MQQYIGIDIAKLSFEADINGTIRRFGNDDQGAAKLLGSTTADSIYIIEATGNYSTRLAEALAGADRHVKLINPLSSRRFAQLRLRRTKSDRLDAQLLTQYGAIATERKFEPLSDDINAARQHQTVIEQLQKQRTALKNQLESLQQLPRPAHEVIAALKTSIAQLETTIAELQKSMQQRTEAAFPDMRRRLETIPGVGPAISVTLIVATAGFSRFETAKQLVSYLGACPSNFDSGTSVHGSGTISRIGNHAIRAKLYMGAMASIRSDNELGRFYRRLTEQGKPRKVALMAVINKMIRIAFALARSGNDFQ